MPPPDTPFERAWSAHRSGRLQEALRGYQQVLLAEPTHARAAELAGIAAMDLGSPEVAIPFLAKAADYSPENARVYALLGAARQGIRHWAAAETALRRALELDPANVEAAARLAMVLEAQGQWPAAIEAYRRALTRQPAFAELWCNLGMMQLKTNAFAEALSSMDRAIAMKPALAEAHNGRGVALKALGRLSEAADSFRETARLRPGDADAFHNLGNTLLALEDFKGAIHAFECSLRVRPQSPDTLNNLGAALAGQKRFSDAIALYRRVLAVTPNNGDAWNNLGNALLSLNQTSEAADCFSQAAAFKPNHPEPLSNWGNALLAQNRPAEALTRYQQAEALAPDLPEAKFNQAIALLVSGDYRRGFPLYEYRWQTEQKAFARKLSAKRWTGSEPLAGKSLLVYAEQGVGDTFQFVRFLPNLLALGASVILEVQKPVMELIQQSFPDVRVIGKGESTAPTDYECPLLSLPSPLGLDLAQVPRQIPYLQTDPARKSRWAERLQSTARPAIGLVCSGNARHKNDRNRSIPLSQFEPLIGSSARLTSWHLLQKDLRAEDRARLGTMEKLADWSASLTDFAETAALVDNLDLILTVDTSVAHLAGALGRPVWLLLPYSPDWRWLLERADSPWYPTMRLFRQPSPGDWATPLRLLGAALDEV